MMIYILQYTVFLLKLTQLGTFERSLEFYWILFLFLTYILYFLPLVAKVRISVLFERKLTGTNDLGSSADILGDVIVE